MEEFIQEYKYVKACSFLKIYLREVQQSFEAGEELKSASVPDYILEVAMRVCR